MGEEDRRRRTPVVVAWTERRKTSGTISAQTSGLLALARVNQTPNLPSRMSISSNCLFPTGTVVSALGGEVPPSVAF